MALTIINQLTRCLQSLRLDPRTAQCIRNRSKWPGTPRYRPPYWYVKKERVTGEDMITKENKDFIKEVVEDRFGVAKRMAESPLAGVEVKEPVQWHPKKQRCGLVLRKIGTYPMWLKTGQKVSSTLLQVVDNHVVKYIPPEEYTPMIRKKSIWLEKNQLGALLVGSGSLDPSTVTKEYCNMFKEAGIMPTKRICRFVVHPDAALPAGTPLSVGHFRVGDRVDIKAKTIDRGFQGVMKRWGFKGMPASHGVTKTHRRPGNIGGGGEKGRVWPGKKMPGHMGNRMRTLRGVKILRINYKYNVMWCLGVAIPGGVGELCYVFDTKLPLRRLATAPPFPTYFPTGDEPEEVYDDSVHQFKDPTIMFPEE